MSAIRNIDERKIALTLLICMADHDLQWFALMGFYDDSADLIADVAFTLGVPCDKPFMNKLTKVVRRMVQYGVFSAEMRGTHKEYMGEPAKQMEYSLKPGKLGLLQRGKTEHTMEPLGEAGFLLRHAYPNPDYE